MYTVCQLVNCEVKRENVHDLDCAPRQNVSQTVIESYQLLVLEEGLSTSLCP